MPRASSVVVPVARLALAAALACALLAVVALAPRQAAAATNYVVRSTADSGGTCPNASCTLRQAIATAVAGDSISFNLPNPSTIALTSGELVINKNLTINGPGANKLTVSGNDTSRVFNVTSGIVSISDLTIADGNAGGSAGGAVIISAGSLTLTKVVVRDSEGADGGGISATAGVAVSVIDSTISGNTATAFHGGGISLGGAGASLTMSGSTVSGNNASSTAVGFGGGGGINTTVVVVVGYPPRAESGGA
jgi:hypothetical protein